MMMTNDHKDFEAARTMFEQSLAIDPSFAEPYHHLAAIYLKLSQPMAAVVAMEQFMKHSRPDNPARQQVAEFIRAIS